VLEFSVLYACFHVLPCWRNEGCYSLSANRFAAPRPLAISRVQNADDVMPALSMIVMWTAQDLRGRLLGSFNPSHHLDCSRRAITK